jgi:2-hydroxy-6-oxonona-2,4-dienedioate hydrolase
VLVPGLGVSGRYMLPTAGVLAGRIPSWVVELPGFGRTPRPSRPPSVPALADAVEAWLEARELERPLLVANSLGCQIAAELLVRRPEGYSGAVLTGPTPDPGAPTLLHQAGRLARTAPYEPLRHDLRVAAEYLTSGPVYVLRVARLALRDPVGEKLERIEAPVAAVRGEHDAIASAPWAAEVARLARGRLHTIPGRGHAVTYSAPEEVAAIALALALARERA